MILDGSFKGPSERRRAKALAERFAVRFLFVHCTAPIGVCAARMAERDVERSVSDARPEILESFAKRLKPPDELPADERVRLDTTRALDDALVGVLARLPTWPRELTG